MSTLNPDTKIQSLHIDDKLYIHLTTGDTLSLPFDYTPRLRNADKTLLQKYHLIGGGIGIHFEQIDEDISLAGIIRYKMTHELMAS